MGTHSGSGIFLIEKAVDFFANLCELLNPNVIRSETFGRTCKLEMFRSGVLLILLVCLTASLVEAEKVGICPAIPLESFGSCGITCTSDDDCSGRDKCCSTGCGQSCMEPEPYVLCQMYCPHGFVLDTNGRPTCNCSQQTEIHEGECPVSDMIGICAETCAHDGNCSTNQKCCSNGCGHDCKDAVFPEKQGQCPALQDGGFGTCVAECQHDTQCSGSKKCCHNGCGQVCVDPTNSSPSYRPGTCPVGLLANGTMGVCADFCETDLDCPTHHKCCSNGCGHVCMAADSLQVIHEGSCPASGSPDDQNIVGLCVEACDNDGDCDENQKCCTNGCGHLCMRTESTPCPQVMCMMWCPYGFKQDSDGCNLCECANQTVIHEGECPVVAEGMMGICMTTCDHDGSCSANQKCCSNGCGHSCQDAVIPDASKAGSCPSTLSSDTVGICSDLCSSDTDCSETYKCCSNGCGHLCLAPVTYPVHTGSCPVGDLPNGASGICSEMCSHDGQCGPHQKCCSNGCGHTCITATDVSDECPDAICQLHVFCEHGFKRDESGCEICSCETPVGLHAGTCPVGLLPEGVVGTCDESCMEDDDCSETQKCCSNGCGHACVDVTTSRNATDLCPLMMCLMWCEHGNQKDQNGCDTCECNQHPVPSCPDVLCALYCPYGNQLDEGGCPMCACNEKLEDCPEVMCMLYCEHGYERHPSGCEICTCSQPPVIRPGVCPAPISPDRRSLQTNMCDNDEECPILQKCCSDGQFYGCVEAVDVPPMCPEIMCMQYCPHGFKKGRNGCDVCECNSQSAIHEGVCPILMGGMFGTCNDACEHDGNCLTNQKCCSNGCGHTCVDAIQPGDIKPGSCPRLENAGGALGRCEDHCVDDTSCSSTSKCCSNGCGRSCFEPDPTVITRPGTCPTGALSNGTMGACYEGCYDDGDCSTNQKCCSNGCGHACVTVVVDEPSPCPDMLCDMFCEFGFVRDGNGCDTCICNEKPAVHLGSCPTDGYDGVGVCMDECYNDDDCSANQKCCSNNCGHMCLEAVHAPVIHEGSCPVGNVPRGLLGLCAELCTDDSSCAANQKCCSNGCGHECIDMTPDCSDRVMCMMFCEHGNVKDGDGCDTCECIEPVICPAVLCMIFCEHGTQKDERGCNTCVCNTEPVTCPPIMCNMWCENGFEHDENGCDVCRCQSLSCPEMMCMMYCENGFLRDEDGCSICSCYTPPVLHPGSCPVNLLPQGSAGICIQGCADDGSCSANQKCCSNGCGHVCMDAVVEPVKAGTCPVVRDGVFGTCVNMCGHDGNCDGDNKCCSNGCGLSCVEPGPSPKPGMCPNQTNSDSLGICVNECEHDHGCTEDKKCCHNGCGMTCNAPVPVTKAGECPAVLFNTIGLCVEDCNNDAGCPGHFKCCSNGCGHVCIDPSPDVSPLRASSQAPQKFFAAPFQVLLIACMALLSMRI
ncbi:prestalk protein isoform X2 [Strongylocentrotus purpuratus]|uniref:Uncharacterized protein n=1 Tax=Strongylocentrotus purpuratus TaxID=7668 RepID=A0A7M7SX07_STRPU|nr:prestalk protein isoform X2 [Strongylocentrotus purpuratus]